MKKILFIAILLATATVAAAQYSNMYCHRVGDTIEGTPNNGYFAWWDWDWFIQHKNR